MMCGSIIPVEKKFTFHYGSILIYANPVLGSGNFDLHSTMVLF